jgi:hypothetical protein
MSRSTWDALIVSGYCIVKLAKAFYTSARLSCLKSFALRNQVLH